MAPNKNTNNTSTAVSPPHSHSGQVCSDPPASKPCKHTQSSVDTTVEPAAKKGKKGRCTKGCKTAADKKEEDEAASSTKDKAPSAVSTYETSAHSKSEDNKSSYSVENTQIGNKLSPRERTIVSIYEVDQSLLALTGKWSIQEAWKVYSEVNRVKHLVDINSKPLPDGFAKPSSSDIYKLFGIGTTAWHNWNVVLKRLSNYPDMAEWLSDNNPDMNNTHELWGLEKSSGFTRVNLEDWMDARDKANKDKAAGKEKASDSKQKSAKGKDKGKSKKGAGIKNKHSYLVALYYLPMAYAIGTEQEFPILNFSQFNHYDDDEINYNISAKLDAFSKFLKLHPYNETGHYIGELGPVSETKLTPDLALSVINILC
ncbi:hypothetical protein BDQ17DRAFT_1460262 [Cyathus striatus]|nr:hypothetical protein BDQ17DRAFT_1460262 [Cyathus striatus]